MKQTLKPLMLSYEDSSDYTGLSVRQLRRKIAEGKLRRVKPSGPTGPTYLLVKDLDAFIEASIVPAGKKAGRKPPRKSKTRGS